MTGVIGSNILVVTIAARNVTRMLLEVAHPEEMSNVSLGRSFSNVTVVKVDLVQILDGKYRKVSSSVILCQLSTRSISLIENEHYR